MWIICDNTKENVDLLTGLGFKLNEFKVGTQLFLDVSTHSMTMLNWCGDREDLEKDSFHEYLPVLPNNFLTQIRVLENLGIPANEIRQILKESFDVVNS